MKILLDKSKALLRLEEPHSHGLTKTFQKVIEKINFFFILSFFLGSLVALDIPSREEINNRSALKKPNGTPAGKFTSKLVAYHPKNIDHGFSVHLVNILNRPQEYNQAMNAATRNPGNHPLFDAGHAIFESQLMSLLLGTYVLARNPAAGAALIRPGASPEDTIRRMAVGLGLANNVAGIVCVGGFFFEDSFFKNRSQCHRLHRGRKANTRRFPQDCSQHNQLGWKLADGVSEYY